MQGALKPRGHTGTACQQCRDIAANQLRRTAAAKGGRDFSKKFSRWYDRNEAGPHRQFVSRRSGKQGASASVLSYISFTLASGAGLVAGAMTRMNSRNSQSFMTCQHHECCRLIEIAAVVAPKSNCQLFREALRSNQHKNEEDIRSKCLREHSFFGSPLSVVLYHCSGSLYILIDTRRRDEQTPRTRKKEEAPRAYQ